MEHNKEAQGLLIEKGDDLRKQTIDNPVDVTSKTIMHDYISPNITFVNSVNEAVQRFASMLQTMPLLVNNASESVRSALDIFSGTTGIASFFAMMQLYGPDVDKAGEGILNHFKCWFNAIRYSRKEQGKLEGAKQFFQFGFSTQAEQMAYFLMYEKSGSDFKGKEKAAYIIERFAERVALQLIQQGITADQLEREIDKNLVVDIQYLKEYFLTQEEYLDISDEDLKELLAIDPIKQKILNHYEYHGQHKLIAGEKNTSEKEAISLLTRARKDLYSLVYQRDERLLKAGAIVNKEAFKNNQLSEGQYKDILQQLERLELLFIDHVNSKFFERLQNHIEKGLETHSELSLNNWTIIDENFESFFKKIIIASAPENFDHHLKNEFKSRLEFYLAQKKRHFAKLAQRYEKYVFESSSKPNHADLSNNNLRDDNKSVELEAAGAETIALTAEQEIRKNILLRVIEETKRREDEFYQKLLRVRNKEHRAEVLKQLSRHLRDQNSFVRKAYKATNKSYLRRFFGWFAQITGTLAALANGVLGAFAGYMLLQLPQIAALGLSLDLQFGIMGLLFTCGFVSSFTMTRRSTVKVAKGAADALVEGSKNLSPKKHPGRFISSMVVNVLVIISGIAGSLFAGMATTTVFAGLVSPPIAILLAAVFGFATFMACFTLMKRILQSEVDYLFEASKGQEPSPWDIFKSLSPFQKMGSVTATLLAIALGIGTGFIGLFGAQTVLASIGIASSVIFPLAFIMAIAYGISTFGMVFRALQVRFVEGPADWDKYSHPQRALYLFTILTGSLARLGPLILLLALPMFGIALSWPIILSVMISSIILLVATKAMEYYGLELKKDYKPYIEGEIINIGGSEDQPVEEALNLLYENNNASPIYKETVIGTGWIEEDNSSNILPKNNNVQSTSFCALI